MLGLNKYWYEVLQRLLINLIVYYYYTISIIVVVCVFQNICKNKLFINFVTQNITTPIYI